MYMLEQENPVLSGQDYVDAKLIKKGAIIECEESKIDAFDKLYLITWVPDPKEMPDADFYLQHEVNVQILIDFLNTCKCGLFCVESTQMGNPHYHGWYQINPKYELVRIAIIKTLQRFGIIKIKECLHYIVNYYSERMNGLHYYKKDVFDSMFAIEVNPISNRSVSSIDVDKLRYVSMFSKNKTVYRNVEEKLSVRQYYRRFYDDTESFIN